MLQRVLNALAKFCKVHDLKPSNVLPTACGSWRRAWRRVGKAEVNMEVEAEVVEEKEEEEKKHSSDKI